jgi:uncharacterized protein (DUF1800 family)
VAAIALAVAAIVAAPVPALGQSSSLEDAERAAVTHLLQRATFGARATDVDFAISIGTDAWLERQLRPDRIDDSAVADRLDAYPAASMTQSELVEAYPPPRVLRERFGNPDSLTASERREIRMMSPGRIAHDLVGAKLVRAVYSERQLEEVMVDFWFNHFNVFFAKGADRWLVADYERTAIRPHVFGTFEDLLGATARHPAMLFYLDNWRNLVPDSMNAGAGGRMRRRPEGDGRQRGYNENYARELLELHTLGVDGGYTQEDVVAVARALTGWTMTRPDPAGASGDVRFRFVPQLHDPGPKSVLGTELPGGRGMEDGLAVLSLLAHHPATADHLARKLVERFITDDPPPDAVERIAAVFRTTGGDLREVTRAIFQDPQFGDPSNFGVKIRSPFELVAASLRVSGADIRSPGALVQHLRAFGHTPYLADVPTGYPETSEEWVNGGAMLQRMNFGLALASGRIRGVKIGTRAADEIKRVVGSAGNAEVVAALASEFLPGRDTRELVTVILDDLEREDLTGIGAVRRAGGLLIGSPDFQHH